MAQFGKKQPVHKRQAQRATRPQPALSAQAEAFASELRQSGGRPSRRANDFTPPSSSMGAATEEYAGFFRRVGAYVVDTILVTLPFLLVFGSAITERLLAGMRDDIVVSHAYMVLLVGDYLLLYLGLTALYYTLQEASAQQATIGKRMFGIMVVGKDGDRAGFGALLMRNTIGRALTNMSPFYIGFLMCSFTQRKQSLHDMMGGVVVVRKDQQAYNYDTVFS